MKQAIIVTPEELEQVKNEIRVSVIEEVKQILCQKENKSEKKEYLTTNEVVSMYSLSRPTLWRWERNGILKPHRIGAKKVLFKAEDIEAIISK